MRGSITLHKQKALLWGVAIVGAGILGYWFQSSYNTIQVTTAYVAQDRLTSSIQTTGKVTTKLDQTVFALSNGTLSQYSLEVGSVVAKGQVVGRIDKSDITSKVNQLQAQLEAERANLAKLQKGTDQDLIKQYEEVRLQQELRVQTAKREWEQAQKLFHTGGLSKEALAKQEEQYLLAQSALKEATHQLVLQKKGTPIEDIHANAARIKQIEVQIAEMERDLLKDKIIAPIDGTIIHTAVKNGQYLQPGSELFTVGDVEQVKITADVNESVAWKIRTGQEARISGSVMGSKSMKAQVTQIAPVADTKVSSNQVEKTTVEVTLVPIERDHALKPGYNVDIEIFAEEAPHALLIPLEAVRYEKDGSRYVWKAVDGYAQKQAIETALESEEVVEIRKGLQKNEQVIINPPEGIDEHARLDINE
ncbi:efflux RND transporter periplasmic adaptor subunit [Brevibacillus migulae]|uniref:efflux RND transporter periplasmic adaptor subunit n=1 Tax=Brevibacillus migulae TaxID=1644114 RepID=UPI00106DED6A|nr:efflux RND transporter periplasmic adaptor subunit [Brevibacillus migulae]